MNKFQVIALHEAILYVVSAILFFNALYLYSEAQYYNAVMLTGVLGLFAVIHSAVIELKQSNMIARSDRDNAMYRLSHAQSENKRLERECDEMHERLIGASIPPDQNDVFTFNNHEYVFESFGKLFTLEDQITEAAFYRHRKSGMRYAAPVAFYNEMRMNSKTPV